MRWLQFRNKMKNKINSFDRHIDIFFEIALILIATALFYIFDKKLGFNIGYILSFIVIFMILASAAFKYLREKK